MQGYRQSFLSAVMVQERVFGKRDYIGIWVKD
jgi:hypothetical protein